MRGRLNIHDRSSEDSEIMKFVYLALWLAGGGLIAVEMHTCLSLLRICELRHEAEAEATSDILIVREKA